MAGTNTLSFHADGDDCVGIIGIYPLEIREIYAHLVAQGLPARLVDSGTIVFDAPVKFTTVMAHYQNLSGRATLNWENLRRRSGIPPALPDRTRE